MISINRHDFEDAIFGGSGSAMASGDFAQQANANELLIVDGHHRFLAKVGNDGKPHYTEVLCDYKGVSAYLHLHETVAVQIIRKLEPNILAKMDEYFDTGRLIEKDDLDAKMRAYSETDGFEKKEAALYLGITLNSFKKIRGQIFYSDTCHYLQEILEGFRNMFLPRLKTYGTNSSLVQDFIQGVANQLGVVLEIQFCDVCQDHVAVDQCHNPTCNDSREPNYVCPAHSVMIDLPDHPFSKRPKVICSICDQKPECDIFKRF